MSLTAQISQIVAETEEATQKYNELLQSIQQLKEENTVIAQELGESQRKLKLKKMELDKATRLYEGVESKVSGLEKHKSEVEYANANLESINDNRDEIYENSRALKEELYELDQKIQQLESKKKVLTNEYQKSELRLGLLTSKQQSLSSKINELNQQITNFDSNAEDDQESLYIKIKNLEDEILEASNNKENFQRKIVCLNASHSKTITLIENVNKELDEIQSEIDVFN